MPDLTLQQKDLNVIRDAVLYLESPNFLMKLANLAGVPAQKLLDLAPFQIAGITDTALRKAMDISLATVTAKPSYDELENAYTSNGWSGFWHRLATTVSGGVGGAFGLPGLAVELPITTGIMFRSIASIACELGHDLDDPKSRLECLTVFSMGGPRPDDDALDCTYITSRLAMAGLVREASEFMAARTPQAIADALAKSSAPKLLQLITRIGAQFNVVVSQKFLAQSVPVIGIATGAAINNAFAGHFNTVARHHFTIRELERRHGPSLIQDEYRRIARETLPSRRKKLATDEQSGEPEPPVTRVLKS